MTKIYKSIYMLALIPLFVSCSNIITTINVDSKYAYKSSGINFDSFIKNRLEKYKSDLSNKKDSNLSLNSIYLNNADNKESFNTFKAKSNNVIYTRKKIFFSGSNPPHNSHKQINDNNIFV